MRTLDHLFLILVIVGMVAASVEAATANCTPSSDLPEVPSNQVDRQNGDGSVDDVAGDKEGVDEEGRLRGLARGTQATFTVNHPLDYVIGPSDVLTINFWRDETMSGEVIVRPDGMISLPLINDVQAAGLRPLELCAVVTEAAKNFFDDPTVSVVVAQINSPQGVHYGAGSLARSV